MKLENIKFKAKSIYNNEWVHGDLIHKSNCTQIFMGKGEAGHIMCPRVDPTTVCQYTGLKDKDGKMVWEGDVMEGNSTDSPNGIIVFRYGAFCLLASNGKDFCIALTYLSEGEVLNRYKVLGSKFDNEV